MRIIMEIAFSILIIFSLVMAMVYIGHRDFLNVVCSIAVATVVVWIDGNMRY